MRPLGSDAKNDTSEEVFQMQWPVQRKSGGSVFGLRTRWIHYVGTVEILLL